MSAPVLVIGLALALSAFPAAGEEHSCLSAGGTFIDGREITP